MNTSICCCQIPPALCLNVKGLFPTQLLSLPDTLPLSSPSPTSWLSLPHSLNKLDTLGPSSLSPGITGTWTPSLNPLLNYQTHESWAMSLYLSQELEVYKYLLEGNQESKGQVASAICEPCTKYV